MTGARHRFRLLTSDGNPLRDIEGVVDVEYVRVLNDIGWFEMTLPADYTEWVLDVDRLIEIYREPVGAEEQLMGVWFLRKWRWAKDRRQNEFLVISGPDQMDLLNRRTIAFAADTPESDKSDFADDMQKAIVRENAAELAPLTEAGRPRRYPAENFSVAPDFSSAPSLDRAFAWRQMWPVLQEIAETSRNFGTPLYFDCVPTGPAQFQFRTFIDVYGVDRSSTGIAQIVFSEPAGNLAQPSLEHDWSSEWNYVWGGGQGEGTARLIDPEKDLLRIGRGGPWGKREIFQDAREEDTALGVASKAFQRMQDERPRVHFEADLLDTPAARFGVDWNFGDRVSARYRAVEFDGLINRFLIEVDRQGVETLRTKLEIDTVEE